MFNFIVVVFVVVVGFSKFGVVVVVVIIGGIVGGFFGGISNCILSIIGGMFVIGVGVGFVFVNFGYVVLMV